VSDLKGAKAPEITVTLKVLKNLGNFENVTVEITLTDEVRYGESVDTAYDRVYKKVEQQIEKRIVAIMEDARRQ
jgi:hypothetical protein